MIKTGNVILPIILMMTLAAMISGCSTANQDSPLSFVDPAGNHPNGWISAHGPFATPDGSLCMDCHGDDLAGGITGISCSTDAEGCHSGGPAFHPADWLDQTPNGNAVHGSAFNNGLPINGLDCSAAVCHDSIVTVAWPDPGDCVVCHFTFSGAKSPGGWAHADTGTGHTAFAGLPEEAVCVVCHEINIGFGNQDSCHNCHGAGNTHPDPDWAERAQHGVAAKQDPGTMAGFETCATCHGADFDGGTAGVTCLSQAACHGSGVDAPHPDGSDWRGSSTPTHTNTDRDNAAQCFLCHEDGNNSGRNPPNPPPGTLPGCFNNTLCHADED